MRASQLKLKWRLPFLMTILTISMAVLSAGCLANQGEKTISRNDTVQIGAILENPAAYNGTTVLISGKVVNQCGSGCWFFLDDGTGTLYVDLLPNNFAIPPMAGSKVTVEGTIHLQGRLPYMVGRNVITDLKAYP
jgi:uncharacterized protein YdeI (BOF family)